MLTFRLDDALPAAAVAELTSAGRAGEAAGLSTGRGGGIAAFLGNDGGFSLLELVIVLAVMGLLMPILGGTFFQLATAPALAGASLAAEADVRNAGVWLTEDGRRAASFVPGAAPVYGTLQWTDLSVIPTTTVAARYRYDAGSTSLLRDLAVSGITTTNAIAHNIAGASDVLFAPQGSRLRVVLTATVDTVPSAITRNTTVEVPLATSLASAFQPAAPARAQVLYGAASVSLSGTSGQAVVGNVHAEHTLTLSGGNSLLTGRGEGVQGIALGGTSNKIGTCVGSVSPSGTNNACGESGAAVSSQGFPATYAIGDFAPTTFSFTGNVDLCSRPEVWQDASTLISGVYQATGTLSLSCSNRTGTVTLIADAIEITGSSNSLTQYRRGVVVFATGATGITASGNSGIYRGVLSAPSGGISLSGSNFLIYGAVYGSAVTVGGDGWLLAFDPTLF